MDEDDVRRAIGLADSCELMAAAFAFPDAELAAALADGSFQSDALACLADAGAATATVDKAAAALSAFDGADVVGLADRMRKGHTILYLTPGVDVPIWPYEASFRYTAEGHEGSPALFRSARTLDVERHMREAGVLPKTARQRMERVLVFVVSLRQPCRRRTGRSPRRRCGMERTCRPFLG